MTDYLKLAIYGINDYIWSNLKSDGILDEQDYYAEGFTEPLTPIIPAQQIPEFNNLLPGQTYMVYDYDILRTGENYWITEEIATYSIVSPSYDKINQIINYLQALMSRFDDAAHDINAFNNNTTPFEYHFFYNEETLSPQNFSTEGGFMLGEVKIRYTYVRKD
jgi:hypothetical protein